MSGSECYSKNDIKKMFHAIGFCTIAHHGQMRKGRDGVPYASHPIAVMALIANDPTISVPPNAYVAAALHDVVEDTEATLEAIEMLFGVEVAHIVSKLTDQSNSHDHRLDSIRNMRGETVAIIIKMADRLSNISEESEFSETYKNKPDVIESTKLLLSVAKESGLDKTKLYKDLNKIYCDGT